MGSLEQDCCLRQACRGSRARRPYRVKCAAQMSGFCGDARSTGRRPPFSQMEQILRPLHATYVLIKAPPSEGSPPSHSTGGHGAGGCLGREDTIRPKPGGERPEAALERGSKAAASLGWRIPPPHGRRRARREGGWPPALEGTRAERAPPLEGGRRPSVEEDH